MKKNVFLIVVLILNVSCMKNGYVELQDKKIEVLEKKIDDLEKKINEKCNDDKNNIKIAIKIDSLSNLIGRSDLFKRKK